MRGARLQGEADDVTWNAAWSTERAKPVRRRQYFSFSEIADALTRDPRTLEVDAVLKGRVNADLTEWVMRQLFDLDGGEIVTLSGDPPDFKPLTAPQPGDIPAFAPEALMARRDACRRYVEANAELPGAPGMQRLWFGASEIAGLENIQAVIDAASQGSKPTSAGTKSRKRPGPAPGALRRYDAGDRALFPEIDRLMETEHISVHAAALKLSLGEVDGKVVEGSGNADSRAKRLGGLYHRAEREAGSKFAETP